MNVFVFAFPCKPLLPQECIPVGCITPTLYHREGSLSMGSLSGWSLSRDLCLSRGSVSRGSLSRGLCPGGICPGGLCPETPGKNMESETDTPGRNMTPGRDIMQRPPENRMTDKCKNITLPKTLFAGGKYSQLWKWNENLHYITCLTSLQCLIPTSPNGTSSWVWSSFTPIIKFTLKGKFCAMRVTRIIARHMYRLCIRICCVFRCLHRFTSSYKLWKKTQM